MQGDILAVGSNLADDIARARNTPTPQNTAFNNDAGAIRGAIQEILEKVRFLEDFIPNIS